MKQLFKINYNILIMNINKAFETIIEYCNKHRGIDKSICFNNGCKFCKKVNIKYLCSYSCKIATAIHDNEIKILRE